MCVWVMGLDVGKPREEYTTCLLWHTQSLNTSGRREQHSMGSIPKFQNNINSQQPTKLCRSVFFSFFPCLTIANHSWTVANCPVAVYYILNLPNYHHHRNQVHHHQSKLKQTRFRRYHWSQQPHHSIAQLRFRRNHLKMILMISSHPWPNGNNLTKTNSLSKYSQVRVVLMRDSFGSSELTMTHYFERAAITHTHFQIPLKCMTTARRRDTHFRGRVVSDGNSSCSESVPPKRTTNKVCLADICRQRSMNPILNALPR